MPSTHRVATIHERISMDRFEAIIGSLVRSLGFRLVAVVRIRMSVGVGFAYRLERHNGLDAPPEILQGVHEAIPMLLGLRDDVVRLEYETVRIKHHLLMTCHEISIDVRGRMNLTGVDWSSVIYDLAAEHGARIVDVVRSPDGIKAWVERNVSSGVLNMIRDEAPVRLMSAQRRAAGTSVVLRDPAVDVRLDGLSDRVDAHETAVAVEIAIVTSAVSAIEHRVAGLEDLPHEVAALVAAAEFQTGVLIEVKARISSVEGQVLDHEFLLEDVLRPVVEGQLHRANMPAEAKVVRGVARFLLNAIGGDMFGDQVDLGLMR